MMATATEKYEPREVEKAEISTSQGQAMPNQEVPRQNQPPATTLDKTTGANSPLQFDSAYKSDVEGSPNESGLQNSSLCYSCLHILIKVPRKRPSSLASNLLSDCQFFQAISRTSIGSLPSQNHVRHKRVSWGRCADFINQ